MRLRVWYLAIVLLLPVHVQAAESPATGVLVLSGGRLIDGFGGTPIENAVVVVRGNRIEAVGRAGAIAIPADARTIDVSGMTLLPGLWESHGHLMHIGEGDPERAALLAYYGFFGTFWGVPLFPLIRWMNREG